MPITPLTPPTPPIPPPPPAPPTPRGGRRRWATWLALALALAVAVGLAMWVSSSQQPSGDDTAPSSSEYSALLSDVRADRISTVVVHVDSGTLDVTATDGSTYSVQGPPGGLPDADVRLLTLHDVSRDYAAAANNWLGSLVVLLLPVLLIVGALVWMSRRTQSQIGSANAFGRSRARIHTNVHPDTTFADIAGYDTVKEEIAEVVRFLREPDHFRQVGARTPTGLLLVGPPGTGKTLLARAVAGEAGVPFLSITGSEFLEMFVGVGAARVRDLFATARKQQPCIVFVDEIDAIGRKRGTGLGGGHDEREQALNQLLAEMDGFEPTDGVIVLAATNRPDVLDPALLRAGRFDRQIVVPLPTQSERAAILAVHCVDKPLAPDVDLVDLARGTPGLSGADLANLVNEAALSAVRRAGTVITADDVDIARDRILLGVRRPSLVLSTEERCIVAHHEAGHAVLAAVLPSADPVHKVTILPAGMSLGSTQQLPERERMLHGRAELDDALAVRLGGRAAELIVFGSATAGACDDLVQATSLARTMVREWGMSECLGELAWTSQSPVFLGEDLVHSRDYADATAAIIDDETRRLLHEQAERATETLLAHRAGLDAVASALLERETLNGSDVTAILAAVEHGSAAITAA